MDVKQYDKRDVKAEITDLVIDFIEKNQCLPYHREWDLSKCPIAIRPHNPVTGTVYSGINSVALSCSPAANITGDYQFCTFAQAVEKGWHVRKGAKSLPVVYYDIFKKKGEDGEEHDTDPDRPANRMMGFLKGYRVFHSSDVEGMPAEERPTIDPVTWTVPRGVAEIVKNSGMVVYEGSDKAFYSPRTDTITIPPKSAFTGETDEIKAAHYSAVLLHEASHWADDKRRLNLAIEGRFGTPEYARGEMRVELSAAFICGEYNLPTKTEQHAGYVQSWLAALRKDKNELFKAAREGQKLCNFLLSFDPEHQPATKPDTEPRPLDHVIPASALPRPAKVGQLAR